MVTLTLFHSADPFRPIERRTFEQPSICVGRDPAADWHIEDAACELSRRHCAISVTAGVVRVRDTSANGVFVGQDRRKVGRDQEVEVSPGEIIHLGRFMITMEAPLVPANDCDQDMSLDAPFHAPMLQEPELSAAAFHVRSEWAVSPPPGERGRLPDAALLEAFCEGAELDPSTFMSEDPAEVMRRAGAAYKHAVLGLSELMGERTSLKSAYRMDRTTLSAADNNPFRWADAHCVAVDLLRGGNGPFLGGAAAINTSFQDIKKHLLCLIAGSRAAVSATLDELAPARIEEAARSSLLQGKGEAAWREFRQRHQTVSAEARETIDSAVSRAFKAGYERHLRRLDGLGTLS